MGSPLLRRLAAAVAATALLGAGALPAQAQEPSPSPSPGAVAPLQVGNADSGRTVRMVPGQELHVELVAPEGEQWQGPATTGPLYLVQQSERADRTTSRLQALRAEPQPTVLRARTDRRCFHSGEPCPQAFTEWSLTVVVDPGPPASGAYPCHVMAVPSPAPGTVLLDERDSGRRVTVQQGHVVSVYLGGCEDQHVVPSATGPLFREQADYRANGISIGQFRALRTGTSTITSATDPACFHTATPCARPTRAYSVEVEVVPAQEACTVPLRLEPSRTTLTATERVDVLVRGQADLPVEVLAYTRPSTTFRVVRTGTIRADGTLPLELRPPANTRLYVRGARCADSPHVVLDVRTALTLTAERLAPRTYRFSGDSLPARSGGLVVSLYRLTADGREVLTAQTRADAQDGTWSLVRTFTGTGRSGFVARTGQDLQNAPGRSGVRSLLVF